MSNSSLLMQVTIELFQSELGVYNCKHVSIYPIVHLVLYINFVYNAHSGFIAHFLISFVDISKY